MLYRLVVGSTRLFNEETSEWERYSAWDTKHNTLDLTPEQAKSLGRRVKPLVTVETAEEEEDLEVAVEDEDVVVESTPRRRGRRVT